MLRVVFMGTPDFSVPTLAAIAGAGHDIVAVYTQPPRPAGRGMAERPSPVHTHAEALGLPVLCPRNFKDAADRQAFAAHGADVAVVVAYGLILPQAVLDAPRHGCLNLHASALPRWRGAAPIQRAVMAGDSMTAAAIMRMEAGLDTGPVCLSVPVAIGPETTAGELHDVLAAEGAAAMVEALARIEAGTLACVPQPVEGVTYASKISKEETRIDFALAAAHVHNHIRGLSPVPGAWFEVTVEGRPERVRVLRAKVVAGSGEPGRVIAAPLTIACGTGAVAILEAQRAGKRPMPVEEMMRGFALGPGARVNA
ncbi:MAG: methionyl-tRNA formyltransferase [Hyphomicrobiaceae bacterium]|nr:methionyl-tRNA formyltransferase [Hyphomicrobiaceae bacterium]